VNPSGYCRRTDSASATAECAPVLRSGGGCVPAPSTDTTRCDPLSCRSEARSAVWASTLLGLNLDDPSPLEHGDFITQLLNEFGLAKSSLEASIRPAVANIRPADWSLLQVPSPGSNSPERFTS